MRSEDARNADAGGNGLRGLFFQPHQDDAIISLGGTIQKLLKGGVEIVYVYMTDGRHGSRTIPPEELVAIRGREAAAERELLGIDRYFELDIEDGTLGAMSGKRTAAAKAKIDRILTDCNPDIVFLPSRSDLHADHKYTDLMVIECLQEKGLAPLIVKYFVWLFPDFYRKTPDVAECVLMTGIDQNLNVKLAAIRLHASQLALLSYDAMAAAANSYFAHALRAPERIASHHVEITGLFNVVDNPGIFERYIHVVQPIVDITEIFHGRCSTR